MRALFGFGKEGDSSKASPKEDKAAMLPSILVRIDDNHFECYNALPQDVMDDLRKQRAEEGRGTSRPCVASSQECIGICTGRFFFCWKISEEQGIAPLERLHFGENQWPTAVLLGDLEVPDGLSCNAVLGFKNGRLFALGRGLPMMGSPSAVVGVCGFAGAHSLVLAAFRDGRVMLVDLRFVAVDPEYAQCENDELFVSRVPGVNPRLAYRALGANSIATSLATSQGASVAVCGRDGTVTLPILS